MADEWKMPKWMKPYRECFNNTGGNEIEKLAVGKTTYQINAPLAFIEMSVQAQIGMLYALHKKGLLK